MGSGPRGDVLYDVDRQTEVGDRKCVREAATDGEAGRVVVEGGAENAAERSVLTAVVWLSP